MPIFLLLHWIIPPWWLSDGRAVGVDAVGDEMGAADVGGVLGKYVLEFLKEVL